MMRVIADSPSRQGSKRKLMYDRDRHMEDVDVEQILQPPKRQCHDVFPDPAGDNGIVIRQQPQGLSYWQKICQGRLHGEESSMEMSGCQKFMGGFHNNVHSPILPPRPYSPTPVENAPTSVVFSMDMDDETVNPYLNNMDFGSAISGVQSDFVPDFSQYNSPGSIEKCSSNCLGGERSPVSNALHCRCVSWRAKHDDNHYVSDYY